MKPRVLFLGENWYGSSARACAYALRRLGCDVCDVDAQTFFPRLKRREARAVIRLAWSRLVAEYNQRVLELARNFQPEVLLAFKGSVLAPATLRTLAARGVTLLNYYPDTSAFAHGPLLAQTLPLFDCVFYTKRFWAADVERRVKLRASVFLPHGYDPEIHHRSELTARDREEFGCHACFVATHTAHKEQLLDDLLRRMPSLDLVIWGTQWERCRSERVRGRARNIAVEGSLYAKCIQAAKINLAIMSGVAQGASRGDETTTRTYEIPACGGFMLHERSNELRELFEEGAEVACFESAAEMAEKIDYYLAHEDERERLAAAAHARCVPAYSYDRRMSDLLAWYESHARGLAAGAAQPIVAG